MCNVRDVRDPCDLCVLSHGCEMCGTCVCRSSLHCVALNMKIPELEEEAHQI